LAYTLLFYNDDSILYSVNIEIDPLILLIYMYEVLQVDLLSAKSSCFQCCCKCPI